MTVTQEYLDFIIDQLRPFGAVASKRMFGGAGLYYQGMFFGLVADDVLYFKIDDANLKDYTDASMGPFKPFGSYAMGYYEVPADVLEDPDALALWARRAFEAAGRKSRKKTETRMKDRKTRSRR